MESPSHPGLWATVRQSSLTLTGCPVDEHGLRTTRLPALGADAVVVTPAHQFPTGAVMTPARRTALIEWAARTRGLIIEDDYDAEFRYDRTPIGAVQGLDPGRVAHVGTACAWAGSAHQPASSMICGHASRRPTPAHPPSTSSRWPAC